MKTVKSKKVGLFTDIHIGLGQNSSLWHDTIIQFAMWASMFYSNKGINDLFIPGDIFHNRDEIGVNTLSVAAEFFDILKDFNIYIVVGNHDAYFKERSDVNSVSIFKGWPNITVIDKKPLLVKAGEKTISFIPWGTEVENIPQADICFGHFEIETFKMNNFKVCDRGMESGSLLSKSPLVISGHFHRKDERTYSKGKIVYLGSPYQQNFGDAYDERGIYIFDIDTEELEFFENTVSPKHIKYRLSNGSAISLEDAKKEIPGNLISLVPIDLTPEEINDWSNKIQSHGPKSFRIDYGQESDNTTDFNINNSYTSIDIPQSITTYVKTLDHKHTDEVVEYLLETYNSLI